MEIFIYQYNIFFISNILNKNKPREVWKLPLGRKHPNAAKHTRHLLPSN